MRRRAWLPKAGINRVIGLEQTLYPVLFHDRLRRDYKKLKKYVHVTTQKHTGAAKNG